MKALKILFLIILLSVLAFSIFALFSGAFQIAAIFLGLLFIPIIGPLAIVVLAIATPIIIIAVIFGIAGKVLLFMIPVLAVILMCYGTYHLCKEIFRK